MIKVEIDHRHHLKHFEICGREIDIAAECCFIVSAVYGQVKTVNPQAANGFRTMVLAGLRADSITWNQPPVLGDGCITGVIPTHREE